MHVAVLKKVLTHSIRSFIIARGLIYFYDILLSRPTGGLTIITMPRQCYA